MEVLVLSRSGFKIMKELIALVSNLGHIMLGAIFTGVLGFLAAIFLMIFGLYGLMGELSFELAMTRSEIFKVLIFLGLIRGVLRYLEQYQNHYLAFKVLALIRDKVFKALRRLAPAKLESRDRGNLISIITSDVELLEVFYAHTVSPISIAFIVSLVMVVFLASFHPAYGLVGLMAYLTVGVLVPILNSRLGKDLGLQYRNSIGDLNTYILDSLRGLREVNQYGYGSRRLEEIKARTEDLYRLQGGLNKRESFSRILSDMALYGFGLISLVLGLFLYQKGRVDEIGVVLPFVGIMSSFGPVLALSNLSNNLFHTLASGERVLNLLEEEPLVREIQDGLDLEFEDLSIEGLDFSYDQEEILSDLDLYLKRGEVIGIKGRSGSGKSTLLKLIMRFWSRDSGNLSISGQDIEKINTSSLRIMEGYLSQETELFNRSIEDNIRIGRLDASLDEVIEASKKAQIHDFIMSLEKGYDTRIGELGDKLSGGERQRLGLARVFLHGGDLILLDEPTSNLDSLNEGLILKALKEALEDQALILVSHRDSTLSIAHRKYTIDSGRVS